MNSSKSRILNRRTSSVKDCCSRSWITVGLNRLMFWATKGEKRKQSTKWTRLFWEWEAGRSLTFLWCTKLIEWIRWCRTNGPNTGPSTVLATCGSANPAIMLGASVSFASTHWKTRSMETRTKSKCVPKFSKNTSSVLIWSTTRSSTSDNGSLFLRSTRWKFSFTAKRTCVSAPRTTTSIYLTIRSDTSATTASTRTKSLSWALMILSGTCKAKMLRNLRMRLGRPFLLRRLRKLWMRCARKLMKFLTRGPTILNFLVLILLSTKIWKCGSSR